MHCPKCQSEVADGAKFCNECGNNLEMPCPECQKVNPSGSKFCSDCGCRLGETASKEKEQPVADAERKQVTALFSDLTGYTAISSRLDPEDVQEITGRIFAEVKEIVAKYDGFIEKFAGDGVLALFGVPQAHEDDPIRAIRAAREIHERVDALSPGYESKVGCPLCMHSGINSGLAVAAEVDPQAGTHRITGDVINVASRLSGIATAGQIVVGPTTFRTAENYFAFHDLGPHQVKGKAEPISVYQVIKPTEVKTRIAASAAKGLTKFVGRSPEVESLKEAFEKVRSGDGQVVGVVGEAGVGKSRLLLEFKNLLSKDEYTYFEGRCLHYGGSMPYLPILDILRSVIGVKGGEQEQVTKQKLHERLVGFNGNLRHIIPSLQELLSLTIDDEEYVNLEPKQRKERTFESIRDLLVRSSQEKPLVLAVEDLHWIDKTTEEFLSYMIGWLPRTRILLLLFYRPEYTHQWGSKSYYSMIGLGQLSTSTTAELVGSILKEGEVAPELRELIFSRAAGNPLFTEELTHSLLENGSIHKEDERFVLAGDASSVEVPDTIQGIIAARMDRMDDSLKRIMQVAAVIGREFAFRILEIIAEVKEDIKTGLINLQGLEFIYEKSLYPELEYIFKHALTQEVAYNSLLLKRRKAIHEQIGQAIENLYPARLEEFYEMLAYHYSKSDNKIKAYEYLKLSAKKANEREALWEAFRLCKHAADTLSQFPNAPDNKRELVQIILLMTAPMRSLGYPEDSMRYLQQCERTAKEIDDERTSANILSLMGIYHFAKGDLLVGSACVENAFREAAKSEDVSLIAPIGLDITLSHFMKREMLSAVDTADRVLPLIEQAHRQREFFGRPPNPYSAIKALKGWAMGYLGDFPAGESSLAEALSFATEINHIFTIAAVEFACGFSYAQKGDGQACVDHEQQAVHCMEQVKSALWLGQAYTGIGQGCYLLGRHEEAISYIEKGLEIESKVGTLYWRACPYLYLSMIYYDIGDMAKASHNAEEALSLAQKSSERDCEGLSRIILGRIAARKGKSHLHDAEQSILDGIQILQNQSLKPDVSIGYLHLGELYAETGHGDKALQNLKKAEAMFEEMGMDYWLGKAQEALARV